MIPITILQDVSSCKKNLSAGKGFSVFATVDEQSILFGCGNKDLFLKNAKKLEISIENVNFLILPNAHSIVTGGINQFCKINKAAQIVIENTDFDKYYNSLDKIKHDIGLKAKAKNLEKIRFLTNPAQITKNSWFIPCTSNFYGKPIHGENFLRRADSEFFKDKFSHEGIFVINDENELVIFNACSYNGVINSIETCRQFFPGKRVRSYVGGFSFPYKKGEEIKAEDLRNLEELVDYAKVQTGIRFYTGFTTGLATFDYLQNALGKNRVIKLQTGFSEKV